MPRLPRPFNPPTLEHGVPNEGVRVYLEQAGWYPDPLARTPLGVIRESIPRFSGPASQDSKRFLAASLHAFACPSRTAGAIVYALTRPQGVARADIEAACPHRAKVYLKATERICSHCSQPVPRSTDPTPFLRHLATMDLDDPTPQPKPMSKAESKRLMRMALFYQTHTYIVSARRSHSAIPRTLYALCEAKSAREVTVYAEGLRERPYYHCQECAEILGQITLNPHLENEDA